VGADGPDTPSEIHAERPGRPHVADGGDATWDDGFDVITGDAMGDPPSTILLLVSHRRNRTLLVDWVDEQPGYEYIDGLELLKEAQEGRRSRDRSDGADDEGDALWQALDGEAVDLVLVDVTALRTHTEWLQHRVEVERPLPLPCLLLASETTASRFLSATGDDRWGHLVDDVLVTPIDSELLDRRIRTYLSLRQQATELNRRHDQLSLLAQVVRHDIANAATVVTGWGEILRNQLSDDEVDALERVMRAGQRIVEIVENSRDLTMLIDAGHEHEVQTMPLGPVLNAEVDDIERIHESATKQVTVDLQSPLPSVTVLAGGMLSSVFANLLSNAVRHNDAEVVEITLTVEVEPTMAIVRLADNGPGIPDEEKEQVFEALQKRGESPGDGLGLSLVKRLVDSYGGRIWFEDAAGGGAVACVELRRPASSDGER
jgi:signal transduction histidine kinase